MASVTGQKIFQEIKSKSLRPVYYLHGNEGFLISELARAIEKCWAAKDSYDRDVLYGDELDVAELRATCESYSLFESRKMILIRNCEKISAKQWKEMAPIIENVADDKLLLFLGAGVGSGKRKKLPVAVSSQKKLATVQCEQCTLDEFSTWARKLARRNKKRITLPAIHHLQDCGGLSLQILKQNIEKAALFGGEDSPEISVDHVASVAANTRIELVFAFTDALCMGDRKDALNQLNRLVAQGEEPIAIVGLVARQFRWMVEIVDLMEMRLNAERIAKDIGLYPKLVRNLMRLCKLKGVSGVRSGLKETLKADRLLKSSAQPAHMILSRLTLNLIN